MKELYTAPEAELLCLTAADRLATATVDFDDLLANNQVNGVSANAEIDIDVKI